MKRTRSLLATLCLAFSAQACAHGGIADVTVFDRTEGRQLPVHWHEGRAWVVGKPGNEYSVRIRNRQGEDVLGVVSVDGVNVVTGETATPQQSGYVISPWHLVEVSGWRKNLASTAAFYFTALPDSYAARTGRPDNVGVIGVALFKRKRIEPPPADIAPLSRQAPAAGAGSMARESARAEAPARAYAEDRLGTGHGRIEASHARTVGFERATPYPQETIAIYYDSYRNLVARGVIREPVPPVYPRPQPRPFPGFVPDPPA
ncbi:MAG: hypothetical protein AB1452_03910 [Pseudomonadota bacterium]